MGHCRTIDSGRQAHRELHAQQRAPRAPFRRRASPSSPATFAFSNLPPSCPAVLIQFHAGAPHRTAPHRMERLPPCCDRRERLRKGAGRPQRCAMTGPTAMSCLLLASATLFIDGFISTEGIATHGIPLPCIRPHQKTIPS